MLIEGWKLYYKTARPKTPPHEIVNMKPIKDGSIWRMGEKGNHPILARWVSDFDCEYETEWWYCIKDTPFYIENIKAKKRYYIKKGLEYFDVKIISPAQYIDQLFNIATKAYKNYSRTVNESKEAWVSELTKRTDLIVFGAFDKENGYKLCGYATIKVHDTYADFMTQKVIPECEKKQINAALVYGILSYLNKKLGDNGYYLSDGVRNTLHKTNFQNYLISYFGFRYAYCKLHIVYRPILRPLIKIGYPLRKILYRFESGKYIPKICAVLQMEEIARACKKVII